MDQYPKNFFDALCETMRFIEEARLDEQMSKVDALDSMENRVSFLLTKLVAAPTATSFSMFRREP